MDLNFRQLRAFVHVAQLKSFTRAAAVLHLSQPALTVQVRTLEERLQTKLLDRNSRTVELTRMGKELLPFMQRTLEDIDALVANTLDASAGKRGVVRIACLPSFAASLLPEVILAYRKRNPGFEFVVRDAVASQVMQLVRNEEMDIGITGGEIADPELEVVHVIEDRLCLIYPAGHALGRRRKIGVEDLFDVPLVLTDSATSVRQLVDAAFLAAGRRPLVACETTYMMTAVAMVQAGLGVTILPSTAREVDAIPSLKSRPIDDVSFVREVSFVKRRCRTLPPACESFLEAIIAATSGSPP